MKDAVHAMIPSNGDVEMADDTGDENVDSNCVKESSSGGDTFTTKRKRKEESCDLIAMAPSMDMGGGMHCGPGTVRVEKDSFGDDDWSFSNAVRGRETGSGGTMECVYHVMGEGDGGMWCGILRGNDEEDNGNGGEK